MNITERYNKKTMENFAINTIAASYDSNYSLYYSPKDTNNFDFISPDNKRALEVTIVITENEQKCYEYEIAKSKGKNGLKTSGIKSLKLNSDGNIVSYYGGSMAEISSGINNAITKKENKALVRLKEKPYEYVDLCICIDDGGLFNLYSFELFFPNLKSNVFKNIFFITSSYFIHFTNDSGFNEYTRLLKNNT